MSEAGERIRSRIKALALTPDETWTLLCILTGYAPDALSDCLDVIEEDRAREAARAAGSSASSGGPDA